MRTWTANIDWRPRLRSGEHCVSFARCEADLDEAHLSAEILKIHSTNPEPKLIAYVADRLKAGLVVGVPTDTFYGLAVDPINLRAVERVYEIKSRKRHKPLSLMVESEDQAEDLTHAPDGDFYA